MKKLLSILLSLAIILALAACGSDQDNVPIGNTQLPQSDSANDVAPSNNEHSSIGPSSNLTATSNVSADNIRVEISDLKRNLNQWHRFAWNVSHNTDKYLTAEIRGFISDVDGNLLGEKTVFVNNLGPADWVSEPFLAKGSSDYQATYEIVSYQFTDGFAPNPEITVTNVKDYLRLTTEDLGDVLNNEKEIIAAIHNLSPFYYSGKITFTVTDSQGVEIANKTIDYQNLRPYTYTENLLWFPIVEEYIVEYTIDDFNFSQDLIP